MSEPQDAEPQRLLDRVAEIARSVRATWFLLLGVLAFAGVTLLGVEDADFFACGRQTTLPLIGVEIPTRSFFFAAPLLLAALYVYFHFQLRQLWTALAPANLPAAIGARPLAAVVHPGLITEWGLLQRPEAARSRGALDLLQGFVVVLLVWLATPLVLAALWWRAMPAHEEWLTLANAAVLALCLFVGRSTWVEAKRRLRDRRPGRIGGAVLFTIGLVGWLGLATALGYVSWRRTEGGLDHYAAWAAERWNATFPTRELVYDEAADAWTSATDPRLAAWIAWAHRSEASFRDDDMRWYSLARFRALAPADLAGVELVPRPADWRDHDVAREAFFHAWCARKGVRCAVLTAAERERRDDAWAEERRATLANIPSDARERADLRGASLATAFAPTLNLSSARLEGADLRDARLEGAHLASARLEGANLFGARLEGAVLGGARLEGADLGGARLEGAVLREARLEGAVLREARLEGADLGGARLEGADLGGARLEGADLRLARLEGAVLREARLEGANLVGARLEGAFLVGARLEVAVLNAAHFTGATLNQGQIDGAVGDVDTVLPRDAETGAQLSVWSCWEEPPPTLEQTLARLPEFAHQDLRDRWLCNGRPREKVGRPAPEPKETPENGSGAAAAPAP